MRRTVALLAAALVISILPMSAAWAVTAPTVTLPPITTVTVSITVPTTVPLPGTGATTRTAVTTPTTVTIPGTTTSATVSTASGAGVLPAPEGFAPANQGLTVPSMLVQVWPEYDSADVLVMMEFILDPTVKLPMTFYFYAPTGSALGHSRDRRRWSVRVRQDARCHRRYGI